jgi:hypothetical protein
MDPTNSVNAISHDHREAGLLRESVTRDWFLRPDSRQSYFVSFTASQCTGASCAGVALRHGVCAEGRVGFVEPGHHSGHGRARRRVRFRRL